MRLTLSFLVIFTGAVFAQFINPTPWTGATAANWTGTGTEANPYLITTAEQLAGIAKAVQDGNTFEGKHIKLDNNISLSDPSMPAEEKPKWTPIGEERWIDTPDPGGNQWDWVVTFTPFKGTFDGGGYTVSNVFFDSIPDNSDWNSWESWFLDFAGFDFSAICKGFFGYVEGATIKNVRLENVSVGGDKEVGGLVANNKGGHIINSSVIGGGVMGGTSFGVTGAGGLVGINDGGIIENSFADVSVTSPGDIGGLVGQNLAGGIIRNSHAKGNVLADALMTTDQFGNPVKGSSGRAGGFVGDNRGLIEDSYAAGDVRSPYYHNYYPTSAGFVAKNSGTIVRSYAAGNVYADDRGAAGFVGSNGSEMNLGELTFGNGTIIDCYATGHVSGSWAAGFVQDNSLTLINSDPEFGYDFSKALPGTIINSFSTGEVVGASVFGFAGQGRVGLGARKVPENGAINSYYNSNNAGSSLSTDLTYNIYNTPRTTAQMQSQGFVDTLNMVAALMGTGKWEYVPGGNYPKPTKIIATNLTDYLGGGNGSESNPYIISTKKHLENFAFYVNTGFNFKDKYVKLTTDIELNKPDFKVNAPTRWTPIGYATYAALSIFQIAFSGTFDGGGYEISGLYVDSEADDFQGLFGVVFEGTIKNLGVVDAWVKGKEDVGILAGIVHTDWHGGSSAISNCWTTGQIEAWGNAGGLIGNLKRDANGRALAIWNSYSTADVKGTGNVGGLVGGLGHSSADRIGEIYNSYSAGNISGPKGWNSKVNGYYNRETNGQFVESDPSNDVPLTTAEMQSKEFVNTLNYWVTVTNEQYWYWQHNNGAYPTLTLTVPPHHSVAYNSNGGSSIITQKVLDASKTSPPPAPAKADNTFAGWFSDEGLTTIFDFDTEEITGDITLHARWLGKPMEADTTWYTAANRFADEYTITTAPQLAGLALLVNGSPNNRTFDFSGKTIILGNNISLNDTANWQQWGKTAFANPWTPIGRTSTTQFKGTFNGNGKVISGVYINVEINSSTTSLGLFGEIGTGGRVEKLGVEASFVGFTRGGSNNVGVLAGANNGTIENCYSTGNVKNTSSSNMTGGLVGRNGGIIAKSYAAGKVNGSGGGLTGGLGGLVGWNPGTITNSYYDTQLSGQNETNKGTPKTTAQMKRKATYETWDFSETWGRNNSVNNGYPYLRNSISEPVADDEDIPQVTFNSNNGSAVPATEVAMGSTLSEPEPPTRNGYAFKGWYSNSGLTVEYDFETPVTADITLYARWVQLRAISWSINNVVVAVDSVENGAIPEYKGETPTRESTAQYVYTFTGWGTIVAATANRTYTAQFSSAIRSYALTWHANGGTPEPTQTSVNYNVDITAPAAMAKAGYGFGGWYMDEELTTAATFPMQITTADAATEFYAKWVEKTQISLPYESNITTASDVSDWTLTRVTWGSANNGQLIFQNEGAIAELPLLPADAVNMKIAISARYGDYIYLHTSSDGVTFANQGLFTGGSSVANATKTMPDGTRYVRFVAKTGTVSDVYLISVKITANTYNVTYNSNGGSAVTAAEVEIGSTASLPANPTRTNYVFKGWYSNSGLTEEYDFETPVTANITLYAKWAQRYTVTFNSNSGTTVNGRLVESGSVTSEPEAPTRTGYVFKGWYSNSGLTIEYDFETPITANITLYARWVQLRAISWSINSVVVAVDSVENGTIPEYTGEIPERESTAQYVFTFTGWGTIVAATADRTYTAQFSSTIRSYELTWHANGGTPEPTQTSVNYNVNITAPAAMAKEGYDFKGWYSDEDFMTAVTFPRRITTVSDATEFYAKWEEKIPPSSSSVTPSSSSSADAPSSSSSEDAPSSSSVDTPSSSSSEEAPSSSSSADTPSSSSSEDAPSSSSVETDNYPSSSSSEGIQITPSSSSSEDTPSSSSNGIVTPTQLPQIAQSNQATQIYNGINLHATHNATIDVYTLNGRGVSQYTLAGGVHNVSLGHLPKGVYIVKVSFGSEKRMLRVPVR